MFIHEIKELVRAHGNIKIRAYYKIVNSIRMYYDYQMLEETPLNGSYQVLQPLELLYYLEEQINFLS